MGAVVDQAYVLDDKIVATDHEDGFVVGLHAILGPRELQVANFGSHGVLDLEDRLIRILLDDAFGAGQTRTVSHF